MLITYWVTLPGPRLPNGTVPTETVHASFCTVSDVNGALIFWRKDRGGTEYIHRAYAPGQWMTLTREAMD